MPNVKLIAAHNISKKFCRSLKRSMIYGLKDVVKDCLELDHRSSDLRPEEFWALQSIDFELSRGQCLGLIGANGAGKSTLLKILAGVIKQDVGALEIQGEVGSLLEVGAGFHPLLTGRENIYLNGSILGMSRSYIDSSFDSIVEFSELQESIDMPIKNYSSGMYVRLGFAIATKMRADVVLLDEILAVGDVKFQAKCFNAVNELLNDSAVVFVSHSMAQVSRICNSVGYMEQGRFSYFDNVASGIEHYFDQLAESRVPVTSGSNKVRIIDFDIRSSSGAGNKVRYGESVEFLLSVELLDGVDEVSAVVSFYATDMRLVAQCNSYFNKTTFSKMGSSQMICMSIDKFSLSPAIYSVSIGIMSNTSKEVYCRVDNIADVTVVGDFIGYAPVQMVGKWNSKKIQDPCKSSS